MTRRNIRARVERDGIRFTRWRGAHEFLHAEPRQTIGNTHLVVKTRQSGITK
jgi:hypothetical protein